MKGADVFEICAECGMNARGTHPIRYSTMTADMNE